MTYYSQIDSHILKEGYLWKAGQLNPAFKRRYFVLYDDRTVKYFTTKADSKTRSNAKGTIYLSQIKRVQFVEYVDNHLDLLPLLPSVSKLSAISADCSCASVTLPINGYNIDHYNTPSNIISSAVPPPNYSGLNAKQQAQLQHDEHIKHRTKSVENHVEIAYPSDIYLKYDNPNRKRLCTQPSPLRLSLSATTCSYSTIAMDSDDITCINQTLLPSISSYNDDIVLSESIMAEYIDTNAVATHEELRIFEAVLQNSEERLTCNRRYAFALIQNNREWILSADNEYRLKGWIYNFHKLCQLKPIFSGYLSVKNNKKHNEIYHKKYCVLFENKLLNCYKYEIGEQCLFDIDLRHVLWLKYDACSLEIATFNGLFVIRAETEYLRSQWYEKICSLFADKFILNTFYDSMVYRIEMDHNEQVWKNRYIALLQGYLVIFQNKKQLNLIKKMTFFSDRIFRDYTRNHCCSIIPLHNKAKLQIIANEDCKYAFSVSDEERKWSFYVATAYILSQWISFLFHSEFHPASKHANDDNDEATEIKHNRSLSTKKMNLKQSNSTFPLFRSISVDAHCVMQKC